MTHAQCFAPVARADARILILGSVPGQKSLQQQQYYAHPRNAFWPIMLTLLGSGNDLPYTQRLAILCTHKIALWDVIDNCQRPGSLDSAIAGTSVHSNDFQTFFTQQPRISAVFFNGAKARQLFDKRVMKDLQAPQLVHFQCLPSTSPANARLNLQQKLDSWKDILPFVQQTAEN